jgi:cobalt-zinc-cadmium efflux system outer membrane protein
VDLMQLQYNGCSWASTSCCRRSRPRIEAQRGYIEALRDYWIARAELERAVGGRP